MITLTINRYNFNELSPDAQKRAIEDIRKVENNNFPDFLLEEAMEEKASELLYGNYEISNKDLKVYYSLSYSQGDGVAFAGEIFASDKPNLTLPVNCHRVQITHSGHYYHEYSFNVELFDAEYEEIDGGEIVLEELRDICRQLARYGYKWIEDYLSDDSLKERLIDAGEVFTESGKWDDQEGN